MLCPRRPLRVARGLAVPAVRERGALRVPGCSQGVEDAASSAGEGARAPSVVCGRLRHAQGAGPCLYSEIRCELRSARPAGLDGGRQPAVSAWRGPGSGRSAQHRSARARPRRPFKDLRRRGQPTAAAAQKGSQPHSAGPHLISRGLKGRPSGVPRKGRRLFSAAASAPEPHWPHRGPGCPPCPPA